MLSRDKWGQPMAVEQLAHSVLRFALLQSSLRISTRCGCRIEKFRLVDEQRSHCGAAKFLFINFLFL